MIDELPTLTSANGNMIRVWNQPRSPGEQARLHLRSAARHREFQEEADATAMLNVSKISYQLVLQTLKKYI